MSGAGSPFRAPVWTAPRRPVFPRVGGAPDPTRSELLLGPPHTGLNHLAEFLFLMHVGSLQWSEIARHAGMRLRDLRSEEGRPVYASFYYVCESFSLDHPISAHRIDDLLTFFSGVRLWGGTAIDGWHAVCPEGAGSPPGVPADPRRPPRRRGPAWVRMSNVFVKMRSGPQDLEVALPRNLAADRFPRGGDCLETYRLVKEVRAAERFPRPAGAGFRELGTGSFVHRVEINPDRDINGVGLVYFANYVTFLDAAERALLRRVLPEERREWRIDRRALVEREIAYYGNASATDRLDVSVRAYEMLSVPEAPVEPAVLWLDFVVRRVSDGEVICLSRAVKVLPARPPGSG